MRTIGFAAGIALALALPLTLTAPAFAADDGALCANPKQLEGFKTCADVAKAEEEGDVVIYSTNPEAGEAKVLAVFKKMFPKIKTNYVRLQAGALYAKVLAERQARSYLVDVLQLSDMGMVLDFQKNDRLVNQQDKLIHTAQYSGYLEWKAKGAPIAFVAPPGGLPATSESWGIVGNAPHPNAARLYMDWFLSPVGQKANGDGLYVHSVRADVPAPPGGLPITGFKLLMPEDWQAFLASRPEFQREWDRITGLR